MVLKILPHTFTWICLLSLSWISTLKGVPSNLAEYSKRVHGHWILQDYSSALQEAYEAFNAAPPSTEAYELLIAALAKAGREEEVIRVWENYHTAFPEKEMPRELIEEVAWGVLIKAAASPSLVLREMALIAAFFSHSTQGVDILRQGMEDPNYAVRALAVKLSGHHKDFKLVEGVVKLFRSTQIWMVRKQAIIAAGEMKIHALKPDLEQIIASPSSKAEEQALALSSLLSMMDRVERRELETLAASPRYGLRLLACEAIAHFLSDRDLDLLLNLVNDPQADVRAAAFQSIALLNPDENSGQSGMIIERAKSRLADSSPKARLSAIWVLLIYQCPEGIQALKKAIFSKNSEERLLASCVLKISGLVGVPLAVEVLKRHDDPYVQLNTAIGLIGLRHEVNLAAETIERILQQEKYLWSEREWGLFQGIGPYVSTAGDEVDAPPEVADRLVRLDLLNTLAMLETPQIEKSIREYLSERFWGVSASASAVLLLEGNEESIQIVQDLCQDPEMKTRVQAALILSLWSRDESVVKILEKEFPYCSRDVKEKILEGIGRIGLMASVPFLIEVLKDPSQSIRAIASMALIECVNH